MSDQGRPGYYRGHHYTAYVDEVKELKRSGELAAVEHLLLRLVEAVEAEAKANCWAVAPAYYEQLAIIYRKLKDTPKETAILTRYIEQLKAPWQHSPVSVLPGPLEVRLTRLLAKQAKTNIIPA
jgi:hypothetical protein